MAMDHHVRERLRQAARWWKWLLLVRRLSVLGIISLLSIVLIGCLMRWGWFQSGLSPALLLLLIAASTMFAGLIVLMLIVEKRTDDALLASALEQTNPPLLDRLNTLVHIQKQKDPWADELQPLIERQTRDILQRSPASCPFPRRSAWLHVLSLSISFLLTLVFFATTQPWRFVGKVQAEDQIGKTESDLELPPAAAATEPPDSLNEQPWADVRISEPGKDLKVAQHEVIPLRIEAASNRGLTKVEWFSSKNGGPPRQHALPPPQDPRYAGYETQLLLEDYDLQSWDVVSYFARATTDEGETHDSMVYFIELIPYREQLEKLPGGEEGPVFRELAELTGLVQRQQEVIRQTQRAAASDVPEEDKTHNRLLDSLAREEAQLQRDVQFFEAALRSRVDDDAAKALDQPAADTRTALKTAERRLTERAVIKALEDERQALAALLELRKQFQRIVAENPDAFQLDPLQQLAAAENGESPDALPPDATEQQPDRQQPDQQQPDQQQPDQQQPDQQQPDQQQPDQQQPDQQQPDQQQPDQQQPGQARPQPQAAPLGQPDSLRELAESRRLEQRLRENARQYQAIEQRPAETPPAQIDKATAETRQIAEELEQQATGPQETAPGERAEDSKRPDSPPRQTDPESPPSELEKQLSDNALQQLTSKCNKLGRQSVAGARQQLAADIRGQLQGFADALAADRKQRISQLQAERQSEQLQQLQARQNQLGEARQFLQDTLEKQRNLQRSITRPRSPLDDQARQQLALQQELEDYVQENPEPFENTAPQQQSASSAMRQAAQAMQQGSPDAQRRAAEAAESLRELDDALEQQQQKNELADAMRMQRLLQQQIEQLQQFEQNPQSVSSGQCQNAGGQAKAITGQLQKAAQNSGAGSPLGSQLRQALSDDVKQQIDAASDRLSESQTPGETAESARQLRQRLQPLAEALPQQPGGSPAQDARQALLAEDRQAIERGVRQLDSIARRQAMRRLSPQAQSQLSREAQRNLSQGITGLYGHNEQTQGVLQKMREELKEKVTPVDPTTVLQLLQQMQSLRREGPVEQVEPQRPGKLLGSDPSNVSPEYRDWVRKYFEELSRQQ